MFSLICVWINDWVNNLEAGDLRRRRGHYDVNVMMCIIMGDLHTDVFFIDYMNIDREALIYRVYIAVTFHFIFIISFHLS